MSQATAINAMTVDVEDYFQVSAFESRIDPADWDSIPARVEANTHTILDLFEDAGVTATFFCLGWVAERYPGLIRRIASDGHEVASHGYSHVRIPGQTRDEFDQDIRKTRQILEDTSGQPVIGYRAASFSVVRDTLWALDVLHGAGYRYSSSIYPVHHDLYGIPDAPRFPFRVDDTGILEVPVSTVRAFGRNFPAGGGGFFRLLPYAVSRWAIREVNRTEGRSCIFYFHPWEVDPEQPRVPGISFKSRFRHYVNLGRMTARLRRLAADFQWGRMDRIFLGPAASVDEPVPSVGPAPLVWHPSAR